MHDWKVVDDSGANVEQMHENMNSELLHKISHKLRLATFRFVRVNHITLNIQISRKRRNPQSFLNVLVYFVTHCLVKQQLILLAATCPTCNSHESIIK